MFREMRRINQQLPEDVAIKILDSATSGVLSVIGDDGYPYGVPLSHTYANGKLYFHCAKAGHKLDAIRACDKASFTVIAGDDVEYTGSFTTFFTSVICFGRIRVLEGDEVKRAAHMVLADKFDGGLREEWIASTDKSLDRMEMLEFTIERMTGKEAKELMMARRASGSAGTEPEAKE